MSRVEEILAFKSAGRFINELYLLTASEAPLAQLPPLVRQCNIVADMDSNIAVYGIERFFFDATGEFAHETLDFMKDIGAKQMAAYLAAAIKLFPSGKVPKAERARISQLFAIEKADPSPMTLLDRKYKKTARKELFPYLQRHLRQRVSQLQAELGTKSAASADCKTIDSVLAEKDDTTFIGRVRDLVDPGQTASGDNPTPAAHVILAMEGLWLYGGNDGMWKFIESYTVGRYLPNMVKWTKAIGSERTSKYCAAAVKLLPKGKVPADEAFMKWLEKLEDAARVRPPSHPFHGVDDLRRVDREHKGALGDMAKALRAFLKQNAGDPVVAFERIYKLSPTRKPPARAAPAPPTKIKRAVQKSGVTAEPDEGAETRRLAAERGHRKIDGSEDPRMVAFMESLRKLTPKDWLDICERFQSRPRVAYQALSEFTSMGIDMSMGRILPKAQQEKLRDPAIALRERYRGLFENLPADPHPGGGKTSLARLSAHVMNCAWQGLLFLDWHAVSKNGQRALRGAGEPFIGYADLPPEMLPVKKGRG